MPIYSPASIKSHYTESEVPPGVLRPGREQSRDLVSADSAYSRARGVIWCWLQLVQ